jgi:hypothetical protein
MTLDENTLLAFKQLQKLVFNSFEKIADNVYAGMDEQMAAQLISQELSHQGITRYFHRPFVWFGERSRFLNFKRPLHITGFELPHLGQEFLPTKKKLAQGMSVIFDVAPIYHDLMIDIGHSFIFDKSENSQQKNEALALLPVLRKMILELVLQEKSMGEIYRKLDSFLTAINYENVHSLYPLGVLGHQVEKLPALFLSSLIPKVALMGFEFPAYAQLARQKIRHLNKIKTSSPFWTKNSLDRPCVGLWAIEPHIARGQVGVKFEELLVIKENTAYWLDDTLPHVRY